MRLTHDAIIDLAHRMEARGDRGFRVGPETARLVVDALRNYAAYRSGLLDDDRLRFRVERWSSADRVEELVAAARGIVPARAAFFAAWKTIEGDREAGRLRIGRLTLRQECRVLMDSDRQEEWSRATIRAATHELNADQLSENRDFQIDLQPKTRDRP